MRCTRSLLSGLHNDLYSFLIYARRTNLDTTTTSAIGTLYEYTVQASLARYGLILSHTGGRADNGIDLLGTWKLPSLPATHPLRVLVQCKALRNSTGPVLIRELEGAFLGAPRDWRSNSQTRGNDDEEEQETNPSDVMALLAATKDATKGVRDAIMRSEKPMGYMHMELDGTLKQVFWNASASDNGLAGLGVITRFAPRLARKNPFALPSDVPSSDSKRDADAVSSALSKTAALSWQGQPWEVA